MENRSCDMMLPGRHGHVQAIDDQFGAHMIGRRPTQRPLGMLIADRAQENVTLTAAEIGVRSVRSAVPVLSTDPFLRTASRVKCDFHRIRLSRVITPTW